MNYIEVKKWMLGEGLEIKAVAAKAAVSPTTITLTLQNKRFGSYLKVKRAFRKFKCPKEFLGKAKRSKVRRAGVGVGISHQGAKKSKEQDDGTGKYNLATMESRI